MSHLRPTGRPLFLLALLYLAGGPMILCGVFLFAKMAGIQPHGHPKVGEEMSLAATLESPQLQAILLDNGLEEFTAHSPAPAPAHHSLPRPGKTRTDGDSKVKIVGVIDAPVPPLTRVMALVGRIPEWGQGSVPEWATPPPLPPPRCA